MCLKPLLKLLDLAVLVVLGGSGGFWWSFGGPLGVRWGGGGRPRRGLEGEPRSGSNF